LLKVKGSPFLNGERNKKRLSGGALQMHAEEVHIRNGAQGGMYIYLPGAPEGRSTDNTDSVDSGSSVDSAVLPINQLKLTNIELSALLLAKY